MYSLGLGRLAVASCEHLGEIVQPHINTLTQAVNGLRDRPTFAEVDDVLATITLAIVQWQSRHELEQFDDQIKQVARGFLDGIPPVFDASQRATIQSIIDQLRSAITSSNMAAEYKARVVRRLNELQSELDKPIPNIEAFAMKWALVTSMIKQAGESATPWLENAQIATDIILDVLAHAYELPARGLMRLLGTPWTPTPTFTAVDDDNDVTPESEAHE